MALVSVPFWSFAMPESGCGSASDGNQSQGSQAQRAQVLFEIYWCISVAPLPNSNRSTVMASSTADRASLSKLWDMIGCMDHGPRELLLPSLSCLLRAPELAFARQIPRASRLSVSFTASSNTSPLVPLFIRLTDLYLQLSHRHILLSVTYGLHQVWQHEWVSKRNIISENPYPSQSVASRGPFDPFDSIKWYGSIDVSCITLRELSSPIPLTDYK